MKTHLDWSPYQDAGMGDAHAAANTDPSTWRFCCARPCHERRPEYFADYVKRDTVMVYIDKNDPGKYTMDISFLPKLKT